ncbi:MAG: CBU_0592 family membrane protein [Arenimonas sp.]
MIGSGAILASLVYDEHTNLSAFVIESAWCVISLYGIYLALRERASTLVNRKPPSA